MFHRLVLAATVALAAPAAATDLERLSDAEREAFRAEVRAYLLENPEVLMEAIAVLERREADSQGARDAELVAQNADALFANGISWVGGNPDGDITVVEFIDYRCGYCRRAHPEVAELVEGDGNIRFIVKEFPILGDQSLMASQFAIAVQRVAGDDAYKSISDALMETARPVTEESLRELAEDEGLDADAVMSEMDAPDIMERIRANRLLGQEMNIQGTPSFVFGDRMVRGYVPLEEMRAIVDDLRS